jgi:hypothetical protein
MTGDISRGITQIGGELVTIGYSNNGAGTKALINDFYDEQLRIGKSAGFTGYGTAGVFNAIMGKEITAGMFASNNILTAIGARPYDHEGMRIAYDLAQKGGIGTRREGHIPDSVKMPIKQVRQPYKELPFSFNYGLGLKALESKDDTIAYQQYIDMMTANYSDALDYDLLRPITEAQPVDNGEEICLTGIERAIASSVEVGETYGTVAITGDMVSPYGGVASDLYDVRTASTQNNFDGYVNNVEGVLSLDDMNGLYSGCAPYWADQANPNNKIFGMSVVALEKISGLMNSQNLWLESVFVQRDFNGVKTMPGREVGGILASAYRNIPIIMDGNYNYDATTKRIGGSLGTIGLYDLDNLYMRLLTPVEFRSTEDYSITRELQEFNVMQSRMETGISKFLGQGRIVNKTA